jgi:hypothetical protein
MTISMYRASVPLFVQMLSSLSAVCDKALAHAEERKIDPSIFLNARLYPDMFAFTRQVQIATDFAKGAAARLAGVEPPKYEDNEASFGEIKARIAKSIAFLRAFKPAQIDGSEDRTVSLSLGGQQRTFQGEAYLVNFVLPNFFFHVSTAYAILRHNGVALGKGDFMQPPA